MSNTTERPRLSFCTWIHDWPYVRRTLPINLALTAIEPVEFCLVDIGSASKLAAWLQRKNGWRGRVRVRRYEIEGEPAVHFSRDKNRAHKLAAGEILVNLDGDNVVGPRFVPDVLRAIDNGADLVHGFSENWGDGTCGRIAITRRAFETLGGYDESFEPAGHQDLDLVHRAAAYGFKVERIRRAEFVGLSCGSTIREKMQRIRGKYREMRTANRRRSQENIRAGRLVANRGR